METQHIKIFGRVQGVGFRRATVKLAQQFEVTGTVANVEDFVEIFVSGQKDEVEQFKNKVVKGPAPFSKVSSYVIDGRPYQQFESFKQI